MVWHLQLAKYPREFSVSVNLPPQVGKSLIYTANLTLNTDHLVALLPFHILIYHIYNFFSFKVHNYYLQINFFCVSALK